MDLNKYIDHTLLKPNAKEADIEKLCAEAKEYNFKSVCINPFYIPLAKKLLHGSDVLVCTVVGFPLGATSLEAKAFETRQALEDGADEIDMVMNIGALKDKNNSFVLQEIKSLASLVHAQDKILKVIFETCLLNEEEIKRASEIAMEGRADFIKTSTGFSTHGATPDAVKIMKDTVKDTLEIKASGGIRDLESAKLYISLGATRLGTSSGVSIMEGQKSNEAY